MESLEVEHHISSGSENEDVIELQLRKYPSSNEEDGEEMYLDDALQRADNFGFFQKRLFLFVVIYHFVGTFHVLVITFIGLSPEWICSEESANFTTLNNKTIAEDKKCSLYEEHNGSCKPVYKDRFYSITQEVYIYIMFTYLHGIVFISSYDSLLPRRASYLGLYSSFFGPDGAVNYDCIVTNNIRS